MRRRLGALRALLRVELRQIRQHPGRTLLLLGLLVVPVAAVAGGGTILGILVPTTEERRAQVMGRADVILEAPAGYADAARARALLPPGAQIERIAVGTEQVRADGRRLRAKLVAADAAAVGPGGLASGLVAVTAGRAPANAGEVALSPSLLAGLGRAMGDPVALSYGAARTITGVVVDPEALDAPVVLRVPSAVEHRGSERLLVALPGGAVAAPPVTRTLRAAGLRATARADVGEADDAIALAVFFIGTIGFFEAALVIAAAFGVTLRRRQREIGLLGSVGATRGGVTAAIVGSAVVLGGIGGVAGVTLGNLVAAGLHPFYDGWNGRWNGPFEISLAHALGAMALGLFAIALAAAFPAHGAARLPIRVALGGRRPTTTPPRTALWVGLLIEAAALALVFLFPLGGPLSGLPVIAGAILAVLGLGILSPWILDALAHRAAGLPLPLRLAVRDAGRFRARNGPVVTAILAGMATSVTIAAVISSAQAALDAFPITYRDDQLRIEGAAAEELARDLARAGAAPRVIAAAPLRVAYAQGMPVVAALEGADRAGSRREPWLAVGDTTLLRALGAESAAAAFAAGRILALDPLPAATSAGPLAVRLAAGPRGARLPAPGVDAVATGVRVVGPAFVVSAAAAERLGFEAGPPPGRGIAPWLVRHDGAVTAPVLARARAAAGRAGGTTVDAAVANQEPVRVIYLAVLLLCVLTGLIVVLVAAALSNAESEGDLRTLHTVGAAPAMLRAYQASRAAYLALLGCLLAVPAGLIPALRLLGDANIALEFVMPWRDVGLTVVALPLVAYAVSWLFARGARPARDSGVALSAFALLLAGAAATAGAAPAAVSAPSPGAAAIRWEPYTAEAVDGRPLEGELGRIRVPEDRARPHGPTIELAFVRWRSTHPSPGPPIVFLEGGPGAPGVAGSTHPATHAFLRLLEHADVVGLDQRGTGLSRPDLAVPDFAYTLPLDRAITRGDERAAFRGAAARAVTYWRGRGVDLAAYDSEASADDIDAVRAALGAERIVLYGASYGTHLALAYLRRHPERVARAVLAKVEGPDHTWKLPSTVQRLLEETHARAAADPRVRAELPDLIGSVRALLAGLERAPVEVLLHPGMPDQARIVVGAHDLRVTLAQALATTRGTAGIPRLLVALERGDFGPLAATALERRQGSVGSAMALAMDCASGASAGRRARIAREAADPANLLGDAIAAPFYPEVCAACDLPGLDLGEGFRGPLAADAPLLLVSGALDARTPPGNVEEIRAGLSGAAHVIVAATGHDGRELLAEEYRDLVQAFLRGEAVADARIDLPFRFEPIGRE